jgi:hypothetical protein
MGIVNAWIGVTYEAKIRSNEGEGMACRIN